jgi:uncharacterized protein HemY
LERYEQAATLNPASATAQIRLAQLHYERGDFPAARTALSHLELVAPNHPAIPLLAKELADTASPPNDP